MANQGDKFRRVKPDMSPYLFHFTKGDNPLGTLKKILKEERLVSTLHPYISFTASPVTLLGKFFETTVNATGKPMYAPFGIGFNRELLIRDYAAANVIYGDAHVKEILPPELLWRYENLNMDSYDFEWLREWRIPGNDKGACFDFHDFPKEEIVIVAADKRSLIECVGDPDFDVEFDYEHEMRKAYPHLVCFDRWKWKGVALDTLMKLPDDHQLSAYTQTLIIGDIIKTED